MNLRYPIFLLLIFSVNMHGIQNPFKKKGTFEQAEELLTQIKKDLQTVRVTIADALEKNTFNEKNLNLVVQRLNSAMSKTAILENLSPQEKEQLQEQAQTILLQYQAALEEAGVLDLWMDGYDAYERDLQDNFKRLPNQFVAKPDNKKLYQELGFAQGEAQRKTFNQVRQKYQEKFNTLKKAHPQDFDTEYFRPYLRVLDYVFKTPYSKVQYDAYVAGPAKYNEKINALKKYSNAIHNLFRRDLIKFAKLKGDIESNLI